MKKTGVLLINLGTPDAPDFIHVWRYLRVFLADKRVITLPALLRFLLLYGYILPFRVRKTTHAYQQIWTEKGSPLRVHGEVLQQKLQQRLGENYQILLAMRYGQPSIDQALKQLAEWDRLIILPLYPQYSSSASGSSVEAVLQRVARQTCIPNLSVIREFYQHPQFIQAQAQQILPYITDHEMILFSYHGLPEQHIRAAGCHSPCAADCTLATSSSVPHCYRAQCYKTSLLLAQALHLPQQQYTTVFQSRLGRTPWIQPYMEEQLRQLSTQGIQRIAVACPSFVADCLETLEEIGIRMRAFWRTIGGKDLTLIPCLNAEDSWCEALATMLLEA
jgi:ferrochelatase